MTLALTDEHCCHWERTQISTSQTNIQWFVSTYSKTMLIINLSNCRQITVTNIQYITIRLEFNQWMLNTSIMLEFTWTICYLISVLSEGTTYSFCQYIHEEAINYDIMKIYNMKTNSLYLWVCLHMCVCASACVCVHTCVCKYIYIYTHILPYTWYYLICIFSSYFKWMSFGHKIHLTPSKEPP